MKPRAAKKQLQVTIFCILLSIACVQTLFAQEQAGWKWVRPSEAALPIVEGGSWQTGLAGPYDRLPSKAKETVRPEVWNLSQNSAGLYLNFKTSATRIVVRYKVTGGQALPHMPATGVSGVDLYGHDINGQWRWAKGKWQFGDTCEYRYSNLSLSAKEEEFRLYLPLYNTVSWLTIGVPAEASFTWLPISGEPAIVAYGTSILQGGCASRPGLAWTNILGRKLGRPVINLGFSGNGQLEPALIALMNEQPAKLFILDCMPNLVDSTKFSREELHQRITSSVTSLQSQHPTTPIVLAEHCCGLPGTNMDTSLLHVYKWASEVLATTFAAMQQANIRNIYLLTDDAIGFDQESTVDGTHPNDIGMMKYADAYEKMIRQILHEEKGTAVTTIPVPQRRDFATYDFRQRHEAVLKAIQEKMPAVLLIGNSIIHFWGGEPEAGINHGSNSWKKYFDPLNTLNLGFGWDRIENVLWRVHHGELDGYTAKKIVLAIGTNNLSAGNSDEEILAGLQHLVKEIQQRQPSATVLLSGIYPRRDMEPRIAALNKKIALLAKKRNIAFIDPGILLLKTNNKIDERLFSDGLHPNEQGYEKLGATINRLLMAK